ncbi:MULTISPECIES: Lrp/AsnC family transcriptional regulator [Halobaculum]|uniref:Lrp/AsnC ligand binding domain-containing protein n=2 Tax=Halobaculum TaxID=43927 RepID=A0A8T8WG54_9EURY|nr:MULTISPECIES: Lrp/AsnC ligand binding domain-containing protein [Halobaculum]QZP38828.1 Lrp/AsnC ligand binding domain-containing protein [Halobaculum magnesiiphilum]QZY03809.1 Lrp/AsnC ligand binding domain-containing protein [Halobaculum roseum]
MVHAFVMVKVSGDADTGGVADTVSGIETVTEAHVVAGDFDVVAEVDAPDMYTVLDTVADAVRGVDGVTDTRTYVSMTE